MKTTFTQLPHDQLRTIRGGGTGIKTLACPNGCRTSANCYTPFLNCVCFPLGTGSGRCANIS